RISKFRRGRSQLIRVSCFGFVSNFDFRISCLTPHCGRRVLRETVRIGKYFKAAFFNHWNLLAFLGGAVFALLTPIPDVVLALVAAGEVAYLGMLGTHPKFQSYVEAQDAKAAREATSLTSQQALERITASLPKELLDRFLALRGRCLDL